MQLRVLEGLALFRLVRSRLTMWLDAFIEASCQRAFAVSMAELLEYGLLVRATPSVENHLCLPSSH